MCDDCRGEGLIFTVDKKNNQRVYACYCSAGEVNRQPKYAPSDKNKERPILFPVWKRKEVSQAPDVKMLQTGEKED